MRIEQPEPLPSIIEDRVMRAAEETVIATGISVDAQNNVYFLDLNNNRVRKISQSTGIITNFAGSGAGGFGDPNFDGDGGPAVKAFLDPLPS